MFLYIIEQHEITPLFLQLLQIACKFSASCRKLVLQRCIGSVVLQGSAQVQYSCNTRKKFLYCSCIVVVLHLYGPLKTKGFPYHGTVAHTA